MINELSKQCHENSKAKGFYDDNGGERNIGEMLALIHSEVSEALEADRKDHWYNPETRVRVGKEFKEGGQGYGWAFDIVDTQDEAWQNWFRAEVKNSFQDELADTIIRIFDLAGYKGIDLEWHIAQKMKYNALRPHKHGKNY